MVRAASARRYTQAVFQIALERGELELWRDDLERIRVALEDPLLLSFLQSPKVPFDDKAGVLSQLLEGIGPLAMNLAYLLVAKGRVSIVEDMVSDYERLLDDHLGIAHAEVATAVPLEPEEKDRLTQRLSDMVGKEIVLSESVDPSLIGGLVARVGDRLFDGSTRSRLLALKESLKR